MNILGASVQDWGETACAVQDVVLKRLLVLSQCDQDAFEELNRAISEKLHFCARWSAILLTAGWMDLDGSMARMAHEMRTEIVGNRDRLSGGAR